MTEENNKGSNAQKDLKQTGQYYLTEKIAQGGMAEIFKGLAYDINGLKRTVCIKKILPEIAANPEFISSLIDEAKIAVTLSHGNIAQTYDLGKVEDDYFIVMEYINGKSLSQLHKRAHRKNELIPIPILINIIAEVAKGLDYMHRRTDENGTPLHIVHRDISPQNIIVSFSGTIKIIDFGISTAANRLGFTDAGILKGKFSFMSPEQARGETLDPRSDIFSLGVILHEMLTGKRLFKAEDNRQTIRNVRKANVPSPLAINSNLPDELENICMKALAKDKRRRFNTAEEMHDALIKFLHKQHPDFQPAKSTAYIRTLFPESLNQEEKEADSPTPHLIIDRTHSALADELTGSTKPPLDIKPYLLEDDDEQEPAKAKSQSEDSEPAEITQTYAAASRKKIKLTAIIAVPLICIAAWIGLKKNNPILQNSPKDKAELLVLTTPINPKIFLDGKLLGTSSPLTIKDIIPEKDYELTVRKAGFASHTRSFSLKAGEFDRIKITLQPEAVKTTKIIISSNPAGATIFIDDKETSHKTPVELSTLKPGRHTLGLFLAKHRFWKKKIKLTKGSTQHFDVQLSKDLGSLLITSQPSGALVIINGSPAGETPLKRTNLDPGQIISIKVWNEGYHEESRELKVRSGRQEEMRVILKKAQAEETK